MTIYKKINSVLPDQTLNKLMAIRDAESSLSWDYGDVANEVYHYIVANALPITRLEACGFVSYAVDNERAPNTIMKYALVAEFFSRKSIRARYSFLPFSHFEFASKMGKDWRKVLNKSASLMAGSFGRPPSRRRLELEFSQPDLVKALNEATQSFERFAEAVNSSGVQATDIVKGDDFDDIKQLVARLEMKLQAFSVKYPKIAMLLAQALLILKQALSEEQVSV